MEEVAIGIDLGTTYSCVAVLVNGEIKIIPNDVGSNTTPSYVTFNEDGDTYVGDISKSLAHENPERTIFDVKRLIGRTMFDTYLRGDMKLWPFQVAQQDCTMRIEIDDDTWFYPEEISARVLNFLKTTAQDYLGHKVNKAVITVPAHFDENQIEATKEAGKMAGLQVLKIVQEATAAAIAYNYLENQDKIGHLNEGQKNCLIFDLGGGTFDVAILAMDNQNRIEIKAFDGHHHIGGEDFDNAMTIYCCKQFYKMYGIDLNEEKYSDSVIIQRKAVKAMRRLKAECEKQKVFLSSVKKVNVSLYTLFDGKDIHVTFDQELFNQLNQSKFQECMNIVERVIKNSKIPKELLSHIILVGGSSRIPRVQEMLSELMGGKTLFKKIDPETAVAFGAAIEAAKSMKSWTAASSDEVDFEPVFRNPAPILRQVSASDSVQFSTVRNSVDVDPLGGGKVNFGRKNSREEKRKNKFTLPKYLKNPFDLVSKGKRDESQRKKELKKRQSEEKVAQHLNLFETVSAQGSK